jgi:hypothetical protein
MFADNADNINNANNADNGDEYTLVKESHLELLSFQKKNLQDETETTGIDTVFEQSLINFMVDCCEKKLNCPYFLIENSDRAMPGILSSLFLENVSFELFVEFCTKFSVSFDQILKARIIRKCCKTPGEKSFNIIKWIFAVYDWKKELKKDLRVILDEKNFSMECWRGLLLYVASKAKNYDIISFLVSIRFFKRHDDDFVCDKKDGKKIVKELFAPIRSGRKRVSPFKPY